MGRFYETSQPHFIDNKMYEAPAELMANVLMNKEKAVDETISSAVSFLDKLKAEALTQDTPRLQEKIKAYENNISGIVANIQANPLEYSKYQGAITKLGRDIGADWSTGEIGTMQKYKKQVAEEYSALDDLAKKDPKKYDAGYIAAEKARILSEYKGITWNEGTNAPGASPTIASSYSALDFDDSFLTHMKANGYSVENDTARGGYIYTDKKDGKVLSKNDIAQAMYKHLQADTSYQGAVTRRKELGLEGFEDDDLNNAFILDKDNKLTGFGNNHYGRMIDAATSYAYSESGTKHSIGNDTGYWKQQDYAREDAKEDKLNEDESVETSFTRAVTTDAGNINAYLGALTKTNNALGAVKTQARTIANTLKITDPRILGQLDRGNYQALAAAGVPQEKIGQMQSDFRQNNARKIVLNAQNTEFVNWAKKNKVAGANSIGTPGWSENTKLVEAYSKFSAGAKTVATVPQTLSLNGLGLSKETKKEFRDVFLQNFDNVVFKMEGTAKGNQEVRETAEGKKIIYTGDKRLEGKATPVKDKNGKVRHNFYVYVPNGEVSVARMIQDGVMAKGSLKKDEDGETSGYDYVYFSGGKKIGMALDEKTLGLASGPSNQGRVDLGATVTMGNNRMVATFDSSQISSPTLRKAISEKTPDYEFQNIYNKTDWNKVAPITETVNGHVYSIVKGVAYEDGVPVGDGVNKKLVFKLVLGY